MEPSSSVPSLEGLAVETVEWLPSGSDAGLVRVRGRWTDLARREEHLPGLGLRRGEERRRFDSLPDARFGRDPAVWRATYLVPAALMDPPPEELWLSWESGARAGLPAPAHGFEPPPTPSAPPEPQRGGEVIGRAVLAERRARRAETAERAQAQRAAEALKAVEVLELRSAELERRLEALQAAESRRDEAPAPPDRAELSAAPALPLDAPPAPASPPSAPPREAADADAAQAEALATAIETVKRLRTDVADQRQRVRRSELLRAADAVALATLREEQGRARALEQQLAESERRLTDALAAREQAAEQVALARQRAAADAAAVRSKAAGEIEAAAAVARTELELAARDLDGERAAHAGTRERLTARERELAAIGADLADVRAELEQVREDAAGRATDLERRLAELDAALAAERRAHSGTATELETARAQLAMAESANRAESVARAALDEEIDRERLASATLAEALETARTELADARTLQADVVLSREQARAETTASQAELAAARDESARAAAQAAGLRTALATAQAANARTEGALAAARQELEAARVRIAQLERELDARQGALASAEHQTGDLLTRIAELERSADHDLERRAREQAEAAAAAARPADEDRLAVSANLDAAAAALRARADEPAVEPPVEVVSEPDPPVEVEAEVDAPVEVAAEVDAPVEVAAEVDAPVEAVAAEVDAPVEAVAEVEPPVDVVADLEPPVEAVAEVEPPAEAVAEVDPPAEVVAEVAPAVEAVADVEPPMTGETPASSSPAPRPRIVTESKHPARADVVGSSKREYPWLRGALVKLAHDDPRAATRLLLGLVPTQRALVARPVEYDLTIRGSGTYAISVAEHGASAKPLAGPRPRAQAAFHVSADVVTLTELLAGVDKRMGRWFGPLKVRGRRRGAEVVRDALVAAQLDLAAAARAGAELEPDVVLRAFAYAIHPAWTKGHRFTVAQEIADPSPQRWHVVVRDGAPVAVERRVKGAPDAVVTMSRATYLHVLRGEPAPSGERPAIRGDRAAVALLRAWTERAQGHGG